MSISDHVSHLKSPLLVAFSPKAVLKVLAAFDPCPLLEGDVEEIENQPLTLESNLAE